MVKRFVLMFFLGIFILTGCETQKEIKAKTVFENNFTLEYNTLQIKGVLKTTADGEIKVNVKKPDNLNGLEIKTKDDKITASFKGIKTTLDENKINDPNCVKAVLTKDGRALYFSRSRVPFKREITEENKNIPYWQHCGIYGYRREALQRFVSLPASNLEQLEKLEQLRALEDGMVLKCVVIDSAGPAIDTAADLAAAEEYSLKNR